MKFLRIISMAIFLMTMCWLDAGLECSDPSLARISDQSPGQRCDLSRAAEKHRDDKVEKDQKKEEDLWEDEDAFSEDDEEELTIADPLYYFNKGIWHFNDFVFLYIGEPAARGYNKIFPETVRGGVSAISSPTWYTPVRLVSCLLQAKWERPVPKPDGF